MAKCLAQINPRNFLSDRVIDPSFLDQRHEQRTGFFMRLNLECRQCILVSMAASCRFSPDDHNFSRPGCRGSPLRSRLNDSYHFHRGRFLDLFDC